MYAFLFLALSLFQGPGDTLYKQYETESVDFFNYKVDFMYPEIQPLPVVKPVNADPVHYPDIQPGMVYYENYVKLEKLQNLHIEDWKSKKTAPGYRVQLYTGGDMNALNDIKMKFLMAFPDIEVYQTYSKPNFRLRVGDFMDKNAADILCNELRVEYPGAFVVKDDVVLPKFRE